MAAPFFRVRLTIGDENGKVMDRFWNHFMPKGELIRGSDGTWMPADEAYTGALKKIVTPSMQAFPASGLAKLLAGDRPVPTRNAPMSSVVESPQPPPAPDGGRIMATTIGLVGAGTLAVAALVLRAVRRRRRMIVPPRIA